MAWPRAERDVWRELIEALRSERRRQGITMPELEERLGICHRYLEKLENGAQRPSTFMLTCWAWTLGFRLQLAPLDDAALAKGPPVFEPSDRIRRRLPRTDPLPL